MVLIGGADKMAKMLVSTRIPTRGLYQVSCGRVVHDLGDCCLFDPGTMCDNQCICYQNGEDITMTAASSTVRAPL